MSHLWLPTDCKTHHQQSPNLFFTALFLDSAIDFIAFGGLSIRCNDSGQTWFWDPEAVPA